jgi:hypothetical protein
VGVMSHILNCAVACRYGQSCWEEEGAGSEVLSVTRLQAAFKDLMMM